MICIARWRRALHVLANLFVTRRRKDAAPASDSERLRAVHETDMRLERQRRRARSVAGHRDPRHRDALHQTLTRITLKARLGWLSK